jgi:3-oxoacyl-[acyl-carrier protein] reductase
MKPPRKPLAMISGGTGYLGSAIAAELTRHNWQVALFSREKIPGNPDIFLCDVTNETSVHRTIERIVEEFGDVHACIHAAAAALTRKPIASLSVDDFKADVETSLFGAFFLYRHAIKHISKGGVIIGITTAGMESNPPPPTPARIFRQNLHFEAFCERLPRNYRGMKYA